VVYADVDYGVEGMTQGGVYADIFDSVEWGCSAMSPGADSLIWRVFPNDGSRAESIWFEFELPAGLTSVQTTYYEMSLTGAGGAPSQMEVIINGTIVREGFPVEAGCVRTIEPDHPLDLFIAGGRNRIEVWSAANGSGAQHGLQGVWVRFEFQS
jgi:hypothetical protein